MDVYAVSLGIEQFIVMDFPFAENGTVSIDLRLARRLRDTLSELLDKLENGDSDE